MIEKKLRDLQDNLRNGGWRIKWIPWQQPGKLEYVFNTTLTKFMIILGIGFFVGGLPLAHTLVDDIAFLAIRKYDPTWIGIGFMVLGLFILFFSRIVAAYQKQKGWIKIEATCVDREVGEGIDSEGDIFWDYRLLCVFDYNGKEYKVTPEHSKMVGFNKEHQVTSYLNSKITVENKCFLYVDPKNPLHAVFDRKQKV